MKRNVAGMFAIAGIGIIALAIILGPLVSPQEFSWLRHSTSEQASQNLAGAWVMRIGFVSYGVGTAIASILDWRSRTLVRAALLMFGLGMTGTAIWSNASIIPGAASDFHEDWLHSVASGVVGTAFAVACAARLFAPGGSVRDKLAWTGMVVAIVFPLAMGEFADVRGLIQRTMFAVFSLSVGSSRLLATTRSRISRHGEPAALSVDWASWCRRS